MPAVCTIKQLTFGYKVQQPLFEGVSVDLQSGRIIVLFGANGSGKTTLGKLILGLLAPGSGTIELKNGLTRPGRRSAVFQNVMASLLPWKNCQRNVELPLRLSGAEPDGVSSVALSYLEQFAPGVSPKAYPVDVSGGQGQMVAWARAFVTKPELMLLDEPFASLDTNNTDRLSRRLVAEAEAGLCALLIVHNLDQALLLADEIFVLSDPPNESLLSLSIEERKPRQREFLTSTTANRIRERILKETL